MAKKFLAILLSVLMLVSVFSVSASAIGESSRLEKRVEEVLSVFIGNGDDVKVEIGSDFLNALKKNGSGYGRVAKTMSTYAVVAAADVDDVDAVAQAIADGSAYKIVVLENGKKTVYISVDLTANPEIFEEDVFRAAVVKLIDKQNEVIPEGEAENFELLDYNRFAGELYLHMFLYQIVEPFKDIEWMPMVADVYAMTKVADINIDEARIPPFIMTVVGYIMLEFLGKLGL